MLPGDRVWLRAHRGVEIERRVVRVKADVVAVCLDEEFEEAVAQHREPLCVGFPLSDVLESRAV